MLKRIRSIKVISDYNIQTQWCMFASHGWIFCGHYYLFQRRFLNLLPLSVSDEDNSRHESHTII